MLHAIAELSQHCFRHVQRVLCHEEDADALGADQANDLLDLFHKWLRRIVEQQMSFVEKEYELRLLGIANFGKLLEQLRQQPQQEGCVQPRVCNQLVGGEYVDEATAVSVGAQKVDKVE